MGVSTRFRWCHPIESKPIVYLFNEWICKFNQAILIKWMNKDLENVFHLSIIIDNPIYIIENILWNSNPELYLHYDSLFLSYWLFLFFISAYWFTPIAYSFRFFIPFHFIEEFRLFSHLGFTYTTYITLKREFLIS